MTIVHAYQCSRYWRHGASVRKVDKKGQRKDCNESGLKHMSTMITIMQTISRGMSNI